MTLEILFVLIPVSLVLAVVGLILFVWAVRSGQFDDLDTPAVRMLHDDRASGRQGGQREPHGPDESESGRAGHAAAPTDRSADER